MIFQGALKKLFKFREKSAQQREEESRKGKGADDGYDPAEMPFLDHLEDLRKMFFKIVFTLIIAMSVCFAFNSYLLDWIRLPMKWAKVGEGGPAFFVSKEADVENKIKPGDWVITRGGLLGEVHTISEDERIYQVILDVEAAKKADAAPEAEVPEGDADAQKEASVDERVVVRIRSSAIQTRLKRPQDETKIEEASPEQLLAQQNFLVMEVFQPYEALVLTLKLAFFVGLVLAFPLLMYFVAQFVLPGLKQNEKKVIFPALGLAFLLFLIGASFAFRVGLPMALNFLAEYTVERGIDPGWRIGYYIRFVTQVCLVFGLAFELPVVVLVFVKLGLLTYRTMRDSRAYAIVTLMIISAIFTPPDPMTLILLSIPLVMLYEICIWIAWLMERGQLKREKEEARLRAEADAKREAELEVKLAALSPEERLAIETGVDEEENKIAETPTVQADPHLTHDYGADHDEHGNYIGHENDPHGHDHHDDYHQHHGHTPSLVDINNCSIEDLQKLPGIGPKLAERIIDSRPFYSEDELEYHAYLPESVRKLIIDRIYYG
ncbi:MAG: sec-independent protein translocase protein TatC [Verrucomicrobiales bacterium]|jgi:sec-independent protein translocase protein TatC